MNYSSSSPLIKPCSPTFIVTHTQATRPSLKRWGSIFQKLILTISLTTTFFGKAPTTPRSCWFKPYAAVIVQQEVTWVGNGETFFTSTSPTIVFG